MAEWSFSGVEEAIKLMERADIYDDETKEEMLAAGAADMIARINNNVARGKFRLSDYMNHVKAGKMKVDKSGVPYVTVSPSGKNAHGVNRGTVMFVLNYGRQEKFGKITGDYFWTKARAEAQKHFPEIVEKFTADKLKERGLI